MSHLFYARITFQHFYQRDSSPSMQNNECKISISTGVIVIPFWRVSIRSIEKREITDKSWQKMKQPKSMEERISISSPNAQLKD